MRPLRTLLFAPGNRPRILQKVGQCGADAVILDLEDAVPIAEKAATRPAVAAAVQAITSVPVYVRINPLVATTGFSQAIGEADIDAVVCPALAGIILPKAESPDDVRQADTLLTTLEEQRGIAPGSIDLVPIIETALGVQRAYDIATAGTRVKHCAFGAGDFTRDIGVRWSRREMESQYARSALVVASRAAGLEAPFDTVWVDLQDQRGLVRSARFAKQLGFQGKMLIHPSQVAPVNAVFAPSEAEVAFARRVVAAFQEAEAMGLASIQLEGQFIDYPIVESARQVLAMAAAGNPANV
ncbi:MAG: CoA ester lyase [Candidatus Tectomicrobia bacterium]|uniref:CoA ester lyase n=1 Tax=Tectimicrobiota bacterium TaxID=2528274 RepID=A0A937W1I1_UNCTE|nr:CoA ester lyase [Candidatus Tectomicrobia bacterium]